MDQGEVAGLRGDVERETDRRKEGKARTEAGDLRTLRGDEEGGLVAEERRRGGTERWRGD